METTFVAIDCLPETADAVAALLAAAGADPQSTPQRNLDGAAAASWLVVASIAVKQIPATLRALAELLTRDRVTRIEIGDLVVDHPRPQDVEAILARWKPAAAVEAAQDPAYAEAVDD